MAVGRTCRWVGLEQCLKKFGERCGQRSLVDGGAVGFGSDAGTGDGAGIALIERAPGGEPVERRSESEDIRAWIRGAAAKLLGAGESRGARRRAVRGSRPCLDGGFLGALELVRQTEIDHLDPRSLWVLGEHEVGWFDIVVDDICGVRSFEGTGDLDSDFGDLPRWERTIRSDEFVQAAAATILHRVIDLPVARAPEIQNACDVRVIEPGAGPRLFEETVSAGCRILAAGVEDFERSGRLQVDVVSEVSRAIGTGAEDSGAPTARSMGAVVPQSMAGGDGSGGV